MLATYLFARCLHADPALFLKSRLRGHPMSCPKIRARIPHLTSTVDCNCTFDLTTNLYPTPLLHLQALGPPAAAPAVSAWSPCSSSSSSRTTSNCASNCGRPSCSCTAMKPAWPASLRKPEWRRWTLPWAACAAGKPKMAKLPSPWRFKQALRVHHIAQNPKCL